MKIKKGDNIIVISGKDKGKTGKVIRAFPRTNSVLIEGVNVKKKSQRARKSGQKGQIVDIPHPVDVSNVMILDPKENVPTRIKMDVDSTGKRVRIAKKSGVVLS